MISWDDDDMADDARHFADDGEPYEELGWADDSGLPPAAPSVPPAAPIDPSPDEERHTQANAFYAARGAFSEEYVMMNLPRINT